MNKLLSAEFARLSKSFVFKMGLCFSAGLGAFIILMRWMDVKKHSQAYAELGAEYYGADGLIFVGGIYIVFAVAVFVGIFIGTEYGDGTIWNKLAVGHMRKNIYLSKLAVCGFASLLMHVMYIVVSLAAGSLMLGGTTMEIKEILAFTAAGVTAMWAMTAILLLISMSVQSKAAGSVACLLVTMVMLFASLTIWQKLSAPEYYDTYDYEDENAGEAITGEDDTPIYVDGDTGKAMTKERVKNPRYLTGTKRKVYEFLNNFLPVSQLYQIVMNDASHLGLMAVYDCLIILLTAGLGVIIFKKKDLK